MFFTRIVGQMVEQWFGVGCLDTLGRGREGEREGREKVLHSRQNIIIPEVHYTQLWYEKGEGECRYTNT